MSRNKKHQRRFHNGDAKVSPQIGFNLQFLYEIEHWYPLLLFVIAIGVFSPSIFMDFTYDDYLVVLDDPRIRQWDIGGYFTRDEQAPGSRLVRTISFMLDYALFGFSPAGYHIQNLFWHALCAVLSFFLLRKLTHQPTFSFFGTLIFAIHPIHVEAVANISNRKEMLGLAFLLMAFLAYIQFLEAKTDRRWIWLMIGALFWVLGLLSKQFTFVLPPLLVAYEYLIVPKEQRFLTKNTTLLLGLVAIGSLLLFLYAHFILNITNLTASQGLPISVRGYRGDLSYLSLIATSGRVFWTYIQLLVWPAGLCPDYVVDLSTSFLDLRVLLGWSGLIAFLIIIFRLSPRWPVVAFGMLWFFISFAPISNWVPSAYILADRYMYMPSVGYCIILVTLTQALYGWLSTTHPRRAVGITSVFTFALTIAYTSITLAYTPYWSNQQILHTYILQCNPESGKGYLGLGDVYFEQGMYDKARDYYSRAIEKRLPVAYNNRGNAFYELGEYEAALKDYNHAISLNPKGGGPYLNRGILSLAQKQYESAVEDFTQALKKFPNQSRPFNARGLAYEKLGNWTKAKEDYGKAISSDSSNGEAYFNLGRVQLHHDELGAAILSYQKAKALGWTRAEDVLQVLSKKGYLQH